MKNKREENTDHVSLPDKPKNDLSMTDSVDTSSGNTLKETNTLKGASSSMSVRDPKHQWLRKQMPTQKNGSLVSPSRNTRKFPKVDNRTKQRKKFRIGMVGVIFLIFIFTMIRAFKPSLFEVGADQVDVTLEDVDSKIDAGSKLPLNWELPVPYPQQLRDPMHLVLKKTTVPNQKQVVIIKDEKELPKIIISGIVYTEDKPSILVGNMILYKGDEIMGVKILNINRNSVELEQGDKKWTQQVRH